jgi:hypothetical protein
MKKRIGLFVAAAGLLFGGAFASPMTDSASAAGPAFEQSPKTSEPAPGTQPPPVQTFGVTWG